MVSARRAIVVAPLLAVALVACGTRSNQSRALKGVSTAVTSGRQIVAVETEYKIQLSTTHLNPGSTTFVAENKGHVAHSLAINGPGVSNQRINGTIPPGASMQLHVVLQSGSYDIFCPLDGHKNLGMDVHVTVGAGMGGAPPSPATTTGSSGGGGSGY